MPMLSRRCYPKCSNIFSSDQSQILYGAFLGRGGGGAKVCINGTGHMTKMSDGHHMMVCEY